MNPHGRSLAAITAAVMLLGSAAAVIDSRDMPDAIPPEGEKDRLRREQRELKSYDRIRQEQANREHYHLIQKRRAEKLNGTSLLSKARRAVAR